MPWLLTGWDSTDPPTAAKLLGGALIVAGASRAGARVRAVRGRGHRHAGACRATVQLVVGGLYRYVRNPMYLAVATTIVGQAVLLGRPALLLYAALFIAVVAAFVYGYEQPTLSRRFGAAYDDYRRNVPAWRPRLRPWDP